MGNEASSNVYDPGDHTTSPQHVTEILSPPEAIVPSAQAASASSKAVTTSSRFSSLFRSQNSGNTSSKAPQHQTSTTGHADGSNRPQMGVVGVNSTGLPNKEKVLDHRTVPVHQRVPLVDGFHGAHHLSQVQNSNVKGAHAYVQHPQLAGSEDPRTVDVTQKMMTMAIQSSIEHHQQPSATGPLGNPLKNHQHSSTGSLGKDLDEWENAWEEDDESSDGEDVIEDHDTGFEHSSKSLHLHAEANTVIAHPIPPHGTAASITPAHASEKVAKVSIVPSDDEMKTLSPEARKELAEAMNGIAWETYSSGYSITGTYDKPNIQMFLPLLRVLGKGSFGKVRCVLTTYGFVNVCNSKSND